MLDQLINSQKDNNARLASIEKSINQLVSINKKQAAAERLTARREANRARRDRTLQRKTPGSGVRAAVEKDKEKKSFLQNILGVLGSPVAKVALGGLLIAGVVKAFTDPKTREKIGKAMKAGWDFVSPYIVKAFQEVGKFLLDTAINMGKLILKGIQNAFNFGVKSVGNMFTGNQTNWGLDTARRMAKTKEERKELEKINKELTKKQQLERILYKQIHVLEEMKRRNLSPTRLARQQRDVDQTQEKLNLQIQEIQVYRQLAEEKKFYREEDFRQRKAKEVTYGMLNRGTWRFGAVDTQRLSQLGYQSGGPIRVPGSGSGDRVPAVVSPGSFVLNREASKVMGFQTGGIPVMLEPGEQVYTPGSWGPMEMMMNSIVPRFQGGGEVKQTQGTAQTGPGYQPDSLTDAKGRPIVVSEAAAAAIMKMYKKGLFRGQDVNSAQRSPSHNRAVGGVANSKHLGGNALDVQTGSSTWHNLKNQGGAFGWQWNNYMGPQGWHFDFMGSGGKPGKEGAIADQISRAPNAKADILTTGQVGGEAAEEIRIPGIGALGNVMNLLGASAQTGARKAKLPGLADAMHMYGEGFRQSGFLDKMGEMIKGLGHFTSSFLKVFGGGIFGAITGNPAQAEENKPTGGFGGSVSALTRIIMGGSSEQPGTPSGPDASSGGPSVTPLGGSGGNLKLSDQQYKELAYIVSGEAARGTADEFGVAASILNRVADPRFPNTIRGVGRQHGQYEAVEIGNARYDDKLAARLKKNSSSIVSALQKLQGRTDFKGQALLGNRGKGDPMFSSNGNFFHYLEQTGTNTPGPANPPQHWRRFIGAPETESAAPKMQTGGVVNMTGSSSGNMRRYQDAMDTFQARAAMGGEPIIVPVPMGGGGGGGGSPDVTGMQGTPAPPELPSGPQVVALLELQNRLAMGAAI